MPRNDALWWASEADGIEFVMAERDRQVYDVVPLNLRALPPVTQHRF